MGDKEKKHKKKKCKHCKHKNKDEGNEYMNNNNGHVIFIDQNKECLLFLDTNTGQGYVDPSYLRYRLDVFNPNMHRDLIDWNYINWDAYFTQGLFKGPDGKEYCVITDTVFDFLNDMCYQVMGHNFFC